MRAFTELIIEYVHCPQKYDVLTDKRFGFIFNSFPKSMPDVPEKFDVIIKNIKKDLLPGLLHWQHPRFHGYFGGGLSYPDILADTLASGNFINQIQQLC